MASSTANKNNNQDDIVEAISALARVRDISEDMLLSTVEEACKAAFRRSGKQGPGAPMNLSVIIARKKACAGDCAQGDCGRGRGSQHPDFPG